jgi:hypothetical protein
MTRTFTILLALLMAGCASSYPFVDRYKLKANTGVTVCAQDDNGKTLLPNKDGEYVVPHGMGFNSGVMTEKGCVITRRDYRP